MVLLVCDILFVLYGVCTSLCLVCDNHNHNKNKNNNCVCRCMFTVVGMNFCWSRKVPLHDSLANYSLGLYGIPGIDSVSASTYILDTYH